MLQRYANLIRGPQSILRGMDSAAKSFYLENSP